MTNVTLIKNKQKAKKQNTDLFIETYMYDVFVEDSWKATTTGQNSRKVVEFGQNCKVAQNLRGLVGLARTVAMATDY